MKENKIKELIRAVKFTIISISAGIIQIGTFALFNDVLHWDYWAGYITSLLLSILWNFTINRKITFKSSNNIAKSMILVLLFYAVFTPVSTILGDLATKNEINEYINTLNGNFSVAVMGCVVNGPGEASHADIGIAGGIEEGLLFKKGKIPSNGIVCIPSIKIKTSILL